jgi:hypothetical protein
MSQWIFTTPRDDGLTGWGRPLQSLFLVISNRHTGEIGDSHLNDPQTIWGRTAALMRVI